MAISSVTRRDFLRTGAATAGAAGLALSQAERAWAKRAGEKNLILLMLVGGPSQLETWDPKPAAPTTVRGPFKPTATSVPGIQICEHLPRMAQLAHRYTILRAVHHNAAPIHETGQQLMQTGRLFRFGQEHPHYGAVLSHLRGEEQGSVPAFAILPGPIGSTGVTISHGQGAGALGSTHAPFVPGTGSRASDDVRKAFDLGRETDSVRSRYTSHEFGRSCLQARRLVETGVRCVTVNMFDTVFDKVTWDCHADGGSLPATLDDYRRNLCPIFDQAYTALLHDLHDRGLLESTLVVAMGEFGRTPYLNSRGGRDHWPGVWSIVLAGGGVRGGQVIGASDSLAAEPKDRPITPSEVAATIYRALGVDPHLDVPGPDQRACRLVDANPIEEVF